MSKLLKSVLATALAFSLVTVTHAETSTKVEVEVTSGDVNITGKVMSDYSLVATIPTSGTVNPTDVDVTISVTDIASLGLTGTHTKTLENINSGLGTTGVEISNYIPDDYSKTIVGTVEENFYTYEITGTKGEEVYTITGENTSGVESAWEEIASHITATSQENSDSKAVIKAGSYIYADGEIVTIESDLTLDKAESNYAIYAAILAAGTLEETEDRGSTAEIYLAEGTTIATGYSMATLNDAATITINNIPVREILGLEDEDGALLTWAKENLSTTSAIISATVLSIKPFVELTAATDEAIIVDIDFEEDQEEIVETEKGKFNVELISGDAQVVADVAEDYTVSVSVNRGATVDPTYAELSVYMKGVAGLGLAADEERVQTWVIENILTNNTQNLDTFVKALDDFEEAVLSGVVKTVTTTTTTTITKDETGKVLDTEEVVTITEEEAPYTYTFTQAGTDTHYGIVGTQTGAPEAWNALVEHLTAETTTEDSYISVAAGSYLVIDGQTLVVGEDGLTLDNLADRAGNYEAILEATTLENDDLGTTDAEVEIYLLAGTQLAVGSSIVTLNDNARIVFDGISIKDTLGLEDDVTVLEWARENIDSTQALISTLVLSFNTVVETFDENDATLDIIFEIEETEEKEIIKESEKPEEDPKDDTKDEVSTDTGDHAPVVAYASLTVVAGLALLVLAMKKRFGLTK